jgi:uncharacterized protein with PQ loop repeat
MELTEMAGFAGAVLAGTAYMPQITHLVRARCSAGISRVAFGIWLLSSVLMLAHAVAIEAGVFIFLSTIQIAAIAVIIVYSTRYADSYCETHLPVTRPVRHLSRSAASFDGISEYCHPLEDERTGRAYGVPSGVTSLSSTG